jgi:hypothetical protein
VVLNRRAARTGADPQFAGNAKTSRPPDPVTTGIRRPLAGSLQTPQNTHGRILSREAHKAIASSHHRIREDKSMRNVAFSIMLGALALLQIAVVASELFPSRVEVAAVASDQLGAQQLLASTQIERKL